MTKLIITNEVQWRILMEMFDDERGVVFISPEMSKRMRKENLIVEDHYNELDYDFGGDCDVMVDFIKSDNSYAYQVAVKEQLVNEADPDEKEGEADGK